ncbi:MAG: hypothetical protein LBC70_11185 [Chitinispirillales bacterium]|nr:hypothetical protein [Chitinispirillales bacterium]
MNNERAGDQVFTNIDQALAGKIISRSKENSGAAEPVSSDAGNPAATDITVDAGTGRLNRRWDDATANGLIPSGSGNPQPPPRNAPQPDGKSIPVIRTVAAIAAVLFLLIWILKRNGGER